MKAKRLSALLFSVIALGGAAALAEMALAQAPAPPGPSLAAVDRAHLFEERAGTWKATCDEMEDGQVYCKMFHIEQFGEWKAKNFVQLGPAWTPDAVGFVVATYLGFKAGTTVTIGVDKHERHQFTAPRGNNLMLSPEVTEKILREMESGRTMVVYFHSYSGVRQLSMADLGAFNTLMAKVKLQMADNSRQGNGK
jgi:invasion protein IalB